MTSQLEEERQLKRAALDSIAAKDDTIASKLLLWIIVALESSQLLYLLSSFAALLSEKKTVLDECESRLEEKNQLVDRLTNEMSSLRHSLQSGSDERARLLIKDNESLKVHQLSFVYFRRVPFCIK